MAEQLTRRTILKIAAGSAVTALLAACGTAPATTAPSGAGPTAAGTSPALAGGIGGQALPSRQAATPVATASARATAGVAPIVTVTPNAANAAVSGSVRYWQTTYDNPELPSSQYHQQWVAQLKTVLPNVQFKEEQLAYNDMLDKLRVALRAGQGPDTAVLPLLWGRSSRRAARSRRSTSRSWATSPRTSGPARSSRSAGRASSTASPPTTRRTLHLEQGPLPARGARPRDAPEDVGGCQEFFQADQGQDRQGGVRPRRQAERGGHPLPLHAPLLGIRRRGPRRDLRQPDLRQVPSSTMPGRSRRCNGSTTSSCATAPPRSRR